MTPEGSPMLARCKTGSFGENLRPFFRFAAEQVDYDFDDLDWGAVVEGLQATDLEADAWFEYPLAGSRPLEVAVAKDVGSTVVFVRAHGNTAIESKLASAISLMQTYSLRDHSD